eukprot:1137796-Pelagomonas_calceolata.AAC.6
MLKIGPDKGRRGSYNAGRTEAAGAAGTGTHAVFSLLRLQPISGTQQHFKWWGLRHTLPLPTDGSGLKSMPIVEHAWLVRFKACL